MEEQAIESRVLQLALAKVVKVGLECEYYGLRLLWAAIDCSTDLDATELVALAQLSSYFFTLWLEC